MKAAGFGPVGRNEIEIGGGGKFPELVGEAKVVTDERGHANTVDLDLEGAVPGTKVEVFAGKTEWVDLVVPVDRSIGTGEHEAVGRPGVGGVAVGWYLGAAAADPDLVLGGLFGQELG